MSDPRPVGELLHVAALRARRESPLRSYEGAGPEKRAAMRSERSRMNLARRAKAGKPARFMVGRLPLGILAPGLDGWSRELPECGAWALLPDPARRLLLAACARTDGRRRRGLDGRLETPRIMGPADRWPVRMDPRTRRKALERLAGERAVRGPDGRDVTIRLIERRPTPPADQDGSPRRPPTRREVDAAVRWRWTAAAMAASRVHRRRDGKPAWAPMPGILYDSGLLDALNPAGLALLPCLQAWARSTAEAPDGTGRRGWHITERQAAALCGIHRRSVKRALDELRAAGVVETAPAPGRPNVHSATGVVVIGGVAVRLTDRWANAVASLAARRFDDSDRNPWAHRFLARALPARAP